MQEEQKASEGKKGEQTAPKQRSPSEEAAHKAKQDAKKAAKAAEKAAKAAKKADAKKAQSAAADPSNDKLAGKFGDMELNRSQMPAEDRGKKIYTSLKQIMEMKVEADSEIRVRARLYRVTDNGNLCFMKLRESYETIQCVVDKKALSNGMFNFAKKISHESIVEVVAKIVCPSAPVTGTTI
jgi:lysyl-tRNA synthetase class II